MGIFGRQVLQLRWADRIATADSLECLVYIMHSSNVPYQLQPQSSESLDNRSRHDPIPTSTLAEYRSWRFGDSCPGGVWETILDGYESNRTRYSRTWARKFDFGREDDSGRCDSKLKVSEYFKFPGRSIPLEKVHSE